MCNSCDTVVNFFRYFREADAVLIVFDVTDQDSFDHAVKQRSKGHEQRKLSVTHGYSYVGCSVAILHKLGQLASDLRTRPFPLKNLQNPCNMRIAKFEVTSIIQKSNSYLMWSVPHSLHFNSQNHRFLPCCKDSARPCTWLMKC